MRSLKREVRNITPPRLGNDVGVIGGTFIPNATAATPNKEQFAIVAQHVKDCNSPGA